VGLNLVQQLFDGGQLAADNGVEAGGVGALGRDDAQGRGLEAGQRAAYAQRRLFALPLLGNVEQDAAPAAGVGPRERLAKGEFHAGRKVAPGASSGSRKKAPWEAGLLSYPRGGQCG